MEDDKTDESGGISETSGFGKAVRVEDDTCECGTVIEDLNLHDCNVSVDSPPLSDGDYVWNPDTSSYILYEAQTKQPLNLPLAPTIAEEMMRYETRLVEALTREYEILMDRVKRFSFKELNREHFRHRPMDILDSKAIASCDCEKCKDDS